MDLYEADFVEIEVRTLGMLERFTCKRSVEIIIGLQQFFIPVRFVQKYPRAQANEFASNVALLQYQATRFGGVSVSELSNAQ